MGDVVRRLLRQLVVYVYVPDAPGARRGRLYPRRAQPRRPGHSF